MNICHNLVINETMKFDWKICKKIDERTSSRQSNVFQWFWKCLKTRPWEIDGAFYFLLRNPVVCTCRVWLVSVHLRLLDVTNAELEIYLCLNYFTWTFQQSLNYRCAYDFRGISIFTHLTNKPTFLCEWDSISTLRIYRIKMFVFDERFDVSFPFYFADIIKNEIHSNSTITSDFQRK